MTLIVSIKRQIFRNYFRLRGKIHVRHWRGHGVHSPFMYGIVRNVFMKNRITGSDRALYQALLRPVSFCRTYIHIVKWTNMC